MDYHPIEAGAEVGTVLENLGRIHVVAKIETTADLLRNGAPLSGVDCLLDIRTPLPEAVGKKCNSDGRGSGIQDTK